MTDQDNTTFIREALDGVPPKDRTFPAGWDERLKALFVWTAEFPPYGNEGGVLDAFERAVEANRA